MALKPRGDASNEMINRGLGANISKPRDQFRPEGQYWGHEMII